MLKINVIKN